MYSSMINFFIFRRRLVSLYLFYKAIFWFVEIKFFLPLSKFNNQLINYPGDCTKSQGTSVCTIKLRPSSEISVWTRSSRANILFFFCFLANPRISFNEWHDGWFWVYSFLPWVWNVTLFPFHHTLLTFHIL